MLEDLLAEVALHGLLPDDAVAELATIEDLEVVLAAQMHDELDELEEVARDFPLAVQVLWRAEDSPIDQRRMVLHTATDPLSLVGGGNRSGKTYGVFQLDVAVALGADHPMVAEWLRLNELPPDLVPVGPGEVVISAPSAGSSRRDHRRQVDALLPRWGKRWNGMNALAEAFVEIDCPGYDKPAVLWFKSVDQGHKAYKGGKARRYHIDEEPSSDEGRLVVEECLRGASAVGGTVTITATPQEGTTWLKVDLVDGGMYGCTDYRLDSLDNVLVEDYAGLKRWLDSLPEDERRMRRFGEYVDRRGLVYPGWTRGDRTRFGLGCVCEPFDVPEDWPRFGGADFGQVNPTAVVWGAIGDDHTLYIYREHSEAGLSYDEHARQIMASMGWAWSASRRRFLPPSDGEEEVDPDTLERLQILWGDPAAKEALDLWARMGVGRGAVRRAINDWKAGVSKVRERIRVWPDGRPRLKVFSTCTGLITELENYRLDPNSRREAPIKKDDHLADALRYLVMGIAEYYGR